MKSIRRQKGHAVLITVMVIPALWGIMSLAIDGARMLQDKARMNDALESATLAIAAYNDTNKQNYDQNNKPDHSVSVGQGSNENKQIIKAYLSQYMTDMKEISSINIKKTKCEDVNEPNNSTECTKHLKNGGFRYFEYKVTASTKYDAWLENETTVGDEFTVSSESTSRKYQAAAVDVVFIADFSGSMGSPVRRGEKDKYVNVINTIKNITKELAKYNGYKNMGTSTVSFVGYNGYVLSLERVFRDRSWWYGDYTGYELCSKNYTSISNLNNVLTYSPRCIRSSYKRVRHYDSGRLYVPNGYYNRESYFYAIEPDDGCIVNSHGNCTGKYDFTSFNNKLAPFLPDSSTASAQGIIRGAQLVAKGRNVKRLMIVLSDGDDTDNGRSRTLIKYHKLCDKIRNKLDELTVTTDEGVENVSSKIAVIGYGYKITSENDTLQACAGSNYVYEASTQANLEDIILGLISEEIGHLK